MRYSGCFSVFLLCCQNDQWLGEADHQDERFAENLRQKRGEQKRSTDWPASENLTNNSLLRQRPRPQENDEPYWKTVGIYFLT